MIEKYKCQRERIEKEIVYMILNSEGEVWG